MLFWGTGMPGGQIWEAAMTSSPTTGWELDRLS